MTGRYDKTFYRSIMSGSARSAAIVLDRLAPLFEGPGAVTTSLVDFGCGTGTWCRAFAERFGTDDAWGLDGDYVDPEHLVIPIDRFQAHDLARPVVPGRRFGLAMSLEVAEHLPAGAAPVLVRSLSDHADHVLFSAAVPGQGGEHHVNEQPLEYWRELFAREGFVAVDCVRPALSRDRRIEPWYRYNAILYVREGALQSLPAGFRAAVVPAGQPLVEHRSPWWRLRCDVLRLLPAGAVQALARLKRRFTVSRLAPPGLA